MAKGWCGRMLSSASDMEVAVQEGGVEALSGGRDEGRGGQMESQRDVGKEGGTEGRREGRMENEREGRLVTCAAATSLAKSATVDVLASYPSWFGYGIGPTCTLRPPYRETNSAWVQASRAGADGERAPRMSTGRPEGGLGTQHTRAARMRRAPCGQRRIGQKGRDV